MTSTAFRLVRRHFVGLLGLALVAIVLAAPAMTAAAQEAAATPPASEASVTMPAKSATEAKPALPHELSPWGMFLSADVVVKAVMIGLLVASLATWTVWFAKTYELWATSRSLRRGRDVLSSERSLAGAASQLTDQRSIVAALVSAAAIELKLSADVAERSGIKERIGSRLAGCEAQAARVMRRGTGLLASVGATAPFIGLFGTVWGIMNSFIGISKAHTTNLAVVAPGIAEALLATAIGLVAAIPAVLMYNQLARAVAACRAHVRDASDEVARLVSRDLDRTSAGAHHLRSARPAAE